MIRLGAVGAGMVFSRYQAAVDQLDEVSIVALTDVNPLRRMAAQRPDRKICSTLEELLDEPLDAVLVLTPNSCHAEMVKACLTRGVPTLCEKPLATTAEAARELVDLARQQKTFLFPAMHCRYRPEIRYLAGCGPLEIAAFNLVWHEEWRLAPAWYRDPLLAGGGVLLDVGINQIDWLWRMVGPIVKVSAFLYPEQGLEEQCLLECKFSSGTGAFSLSWRGDPEQRHTKILAKNGEVLELNHDLRTVVRRDRVHGPWNEDEYTGVLRDFIHQLQQPETRNPGAGDEIVALLSFMDGIYREAAISQATVGVQCGKHKNALSEGRP